MNSERTRKLVFGGLVVVLSGWVGLTYFPPQNVLAASEVELDAGGDEGNAVATIEAELAATKADPVPGTGRAATQVTQWASNPFVRSTERITVEQNELDARGNVTADKPCVLSAIIPGTDARALIDGQVVRVNDALPGGAVVVSIEEFSVTLRDRGHIRTLSLPE